jgi:hypothetical protein
VALSPLLPSRSRSVSWPIRADGSAPPAGGGLGGGECVFYTGAGVALRNTTTGVSHGNQWFGHK